MNEKLTAAAEGLRAAAGCMKPRKTCAVIVAAGNSSRMGGDTPKQFLPLLGMPLVVHALRAYNEAGYITSIVVVARPEDADRYEEYREKFGIAKLTAVVPGGDTRQESVLCGIEAVPADTDYVAIADGARPLTTPDMIDRVCLAAYRYGAASAACRAVDTIKTADNHGLVTETIPRDTVWPAATPQVFKLNVYRAAAYSARDEGFAATDDNSLVEHIRYPVRLVDCGRFNLKVTEPADVAVCEALLKFSRS